MTDSGHLFGNSVTIFKEGKRVNIEAENLCKDDIVILQTGDIVPADLTLIKAKGLEIDEFDITGEIMPVVKKVSDTDVPLYMGSRVLKGTGEAVVVATGEQTEYGKIMRQSWELEQPFEFSFIRGFNFIFLLLLLPASVLVYAISGNFILATATYLLLSTLSILLQSDDLFRYLLIRKELKTFQSHHLEIREPGIIERMGQINTICFDKTGVLTTRDIRVSRLYFPDGSIDSKNFPGKNGTARLVMLGSALCNDVFFYEKVEQANPVDQALIAFAQEHEIDVQELFSQVNRFYEKPFDSENRYMASGFELNNGETYYFIKGDPGIISTKCNSYLTVTGEVRKPDPRFWHMNISHIEAITRNGDTAIALAYAPGTPHEPPSNYMFLCIFQLENSLQPETRNIIRLVKEAGIRSFLLTGDRAETALRIGKDSGIVGDTNAFLTGRDIEKMGWSEVIRQSSYCSIFARLIPSQKGVLIALLQQNGHSIAMVGDGPNDGIALKVADVGISFVKNSSPIARRLSKILINNLADLQMLIEGARELQARIKRFKLYRVLILAASLLGFYTWAVIPFIK